MHEHNWEETAVFHAVLILYFNNCYSVSSVNVVLTFALALLLSLTLPLK